MSHQFPPNLLFPSKPGAKSNPAIIQHANKILAQAMKPVEVPQIRQKWKVATDTTAGASTSKPSPFSNRVQSILKAAALVASATDTHLLYKAVAKHGAEMLDNRDRIEQDDRKTECHLFLIDPLDETQLISETTRERYRIGTGIIGYVASTKRVLNMAIGDLPDHPTNHLNVIKPDDAFNPDEFWMSFEGDPTKDVICVPIFEEPKETDQKPTNVLGVLHAQRPSIRAHFRRQKSREGGSRSRSRGSSKKRNRNGNESIEKISTNGLAAKNRARDPPYNREMEESVIQLARLVAASVLQSNSDAGESFARQAQRFRAQKNMRRVMKVLERNTRGAKTKKFNEIKDNLFLANETIQTLERQNEKEQKDLVEMNKLIDVVKKEKMDVITEKAKIIRELDMLKAKYQMLEIETNQKTAKLNSNERRVQMYEEQLLTHRAEKDVIEIEHLTKLVHTLRKDLMGAENDTKMESAKRMMARFILRDLARSFNSWSAVVKEIKRQKDQCRRIMARIMNRVVGWTFDAWIQYTEEEKRLREVLNRAARKMKNRQIAGAFESWMEFLDLRFFMKDFCKRMIGRYEKKEIAKGLNKWISVYNDERRAEYELEYGKSRKSSFCLIQ